MKKFALLLSILFVFSFAVVLATEENELLIAPNPTAELSGEEEMEFITTGDISGEEIVTEVEEAETPETTSEPETTTAPTTTETTEEATSSSNNGSIIGAIIAVVIVVAVVAIAAILRKE